MSDPPESPPRLPPIMTKSDPGSTSADLSNQTSPTSASFNTNSKRNHQTRKTLRFTTVSSQSTNDVPIPSRSSRSRSASSGVWPTDDDPSSDPGTPNLSESITSIRRTLSLASLSALNSNVITPLSRHPSQIFDSEVLLSAVNTVAETGKNLAWRKEGERRKMPPDVERSIIFSLRRALRSGVLSYLVRAGINLLLLLIRSLRFRSLRPRLLLKALFGPEPLRFSLMISTFTFLNTLTLHLLRLAPPWGYFKRRLRRGLKMLLGREDDMGDRTFGRPERKGGYQAPGIGGRWSEEGEKGLSQEERKALLLEQGYFFEEEEGDDGEDTGERRWQAAVAGAVGSLGLLWETRERGVGVSQQMFVRGLQASYNILSTHHNFSIPHGPILTFGLCCGQIMFAFLLSPETIPPEYNEWILKASGGVSREAILVNRGIARKGLLNVEAVKRALGGKVITPGNRQKMLDILERAKQGIVPEGLPCAILHPAIDSCLQVQLERYFTVFRFMVPVYSALHFIPMLVLRFKHVRRDPMGMLAKAGWGTVRSSSFLSVFVMIYLGLMCFRTRLLEGYLGQIPFMLRTLLKRKETFWGIGFMTCLSLFAEEKRRRAELAMYCLPKALESAWSSARKRAWVPLVPFGENLLGAAAMAMVMHAYKHEPQALSGLVRRVMYQMIGPP